MKLSSDVTNEGVNKLEAKEIQKYAEAQNIAKKTMEFLKTFIKEGVTEKEIVEQAEKFMKEKGATAFWYHGIGAFVFAGDRTTISISGKEYKPTETKVKANDIVTVDLTPEINGIWGDFARTFAISGGEVSGIDSVKITNADQEIIEGIKTEELLHAKLAEIISEESTFEEIFIKMNDFIESLGYENLDFGKNLGHTIEKNKDERKYIKSGNKILFRDVNLFTFEPHIKKKNGKFGFKKEDVYYFDKKVLLKL